MKLTRASNIKGKLRLPGDKSISHRAAMIAAIATGVSKITNFSSSQDCGSTLECLRQLGIPIKRVDNQVVIEGQEKFAHPKSPLNCGNSGSTMRMLTGILAGHDISCQLVGDESLSARPMKRIIEPLELMGAKIGSDNGKPPLTIQGSGSLKGLTYTLPVASAQVKSAILFAALSAAGRSTVIESVPSRDHTELLFGAFGVPVIRAFDNSSRMNISLDGPARFVAGDITIPGDISSAAYFVAAAVLLADSDLTIEDVGLNPTRAEFLSILRACGANVTTSDVHLEHNEPVGTIRVKGSWQKASGSKIRVRLGQPEIPALIDELPLLAVVGSQLPGGIEIRDAAELRLKETDRLKATTHNLRAMGAEVEEYNDDGLIVSGPTRLRGAVIDTFGDHRIAMAFSIAALVAEGVTEIGGADCVGVSFPEFFELLDSITVRTAPKSANANEL